MFPKKVTKSCKSHVTSCICQILFLVIGHTSLFSMVSCFYCIYSKSNMWFTFEVVELLKKIVYIVSIPTSMTNLGL